MRILYVVGTRPNFVKTAPVIAAMRAPPAGGPPRDRPHRPALRPGDVGGLLRGARRARPRPHARGRLRHPRPADGPHDGAAGAGDRGGAARPAGRPRRRQLDPGGGADRGEDGCPGRPRRVGPAQLRPARCRRRSTGSSPTASAPTSSSTPRRRSSNLRAEGIGQERMHFVGNTMIDTLVALEERIAAAGTAARARPLPRLLPARHPAPPGAGRRAAAGRDRRPARPPGRGRCRSSSRSTRGPGR